MCTFSQPKETVLSDLSACPKLASCLGAPPLPLSGRTETAAISSPEFATLVHCKALPAKKQFVMLSGIYHYKLNLNNFQILFGHLLHIPRKQTAISQN